MRSFFLVKIKVEVISKILIVFLTKNSLQINKMRVIKF